MVFSSFLRSVKLEPCAVGNKAPLSTKRNLNVDLSYLPKCTVFFFIDFRNSPPDSNFRLNRFLYRWDPTNKF